MNISLHEKLNQFWKSYPHLTLGIFLFSALLLIRIISGFNGLYGQDSYEYLRFSHRLSEFFTTGNNPGDYFWPVNFPLLGALFSLIIGDNIIALQLISMFSFVFTVIYVFRLIGLIYPNSRREVLFYLSLFFVLSPFLFQSAFLVMSDMLTVFFISAAIFHIFKYSMGYKRTDFLLAILWAASAVTTRYAAGVVLLILGVVLFVSFLKRFRLAELFLGLLMIAFCLSPYILIKGSNAIGFLQHQWLQAWSAKNWILSEFTTVDGYQNYRFPNLLYAFGNFYYPGFFFMGILLFFFIRREILHRKKILVLVAPVVLYALFLAGIPFQNMRFLLLTFPLGLILIFPAFQRFKHKILRKNSFLWSFAVLVILVQLGLIYKYSSGIYRANQVERKIAQTILTYSERPIYTFAIDGALRCYGIDSNDVVNLRLNKLDSAKIPALVLFNEDKFKHQWQGKNPMINWQFIQDNYNLERLEALPEAWELYRVQGDRN